MFFCSDCGVSIATNSNCENDDVVSQIRARIDAGRPLAWTLTVGGDLHAEELAADPEFLDDPRNFDGIPAGIAADRFSRRTLLIVGLAMLAAADIVLAAAVSSLAVFIGAALWGAFRHEKLKALGRIPKAS